MKDKLLIYELDCVNSIFSIDRKILKKIFTNIIIPQIAFDELKCKMDTEIILTIKSLKRSKFVILEDFDVSTPQYIRYKKLKEGVQCKCRGKCESAAIIIAKDNNLPILTNRNLDYIDEYNLDNVSMLDMLIKAYDDELIDIKEAEIFWSTMSIYSNACKCSSFSDYIKNMEN